MRAHIYSHLNFLPYTLDTPDTLGVGGVEGVGRLACLATIYIIGDKKLGELSQMFCRRRSNFIVSALHPY